MRRRLPARQGRNHGYGVPDRFYFNKRPSSARRSNGILAPCFTRTGRSVFGPIPAIRPERMNDRSLPLLVLEKPHGPLPIQPALRPASNWDSGDV